MGCLCSSSIKFFDDVLQILKTKNLNLSENAEHEIHLVSK